jgi:HAD superfamily hydrolase (TIGR01509 family)
VKNAAPRPGHDTQSGKSNVTDNWQIDAVLLDMDGTLLDTEPSYVSALTAALDAFGYPDATAMCHAMIGIPGAECEALLRVRYGENFAFADVMEAFAVRSDEIFGEGLRLKPGTIELLDALREAGCPMAIVTSTSRRTAEQHLTFGGIRARFETLVTCDDVTRGKPSPDIYLLAATRLGVRPQACVVIEDSNPGIAAAYAAEMIAIMVPDLVPPTEATREKCAAVLPDLHAVLKMLRVRGLSPRRPGERWDP